MKATIPDTHGNSSQKSLQTQYFAVIVDLIQGNTDLDILGRVDISLENPIDWGVVHNWRHAIRDFFILGPLPPSSSRFLLLKPWYCCH